MTTEETTVKNDAKCGCGWPLPLAVIAYPEDSEPGPENEIPNSYVALVCPQCERGHAFFVALV